MTEQAVVSKKSYITPGNAVTGVIIIAGLVATVIRFSNGLGAVTNLSDHSPWGIWIWFQLVAISLAGATYVTCGAVYVFGMKRYRSAVRLAVLIGLLGYGQFVVSLIFDLGRPWRLSYPFFISRGTTSILFGISLCVLLYLIVLIPRFSPAVFEWLGFRNARNRVVKPTLILTVLGIVLSTLHQASLGALFLIAPSKLHPLWYSSYLPIYFLVTSIFGGLAMMIFVSWLSERFFKDRMDETYLAESEGLSLGFGKAASLVLVGYVIIRIFSISTTHTWRYLSSGWGALFLLELFGFALLPGILFAIGAREKNLTMIRWTSLLTILGIVLSKFNVAIMAFNWQLPRDDRYFPSGWEIVSTLFIITLGILAFRFVITFMPVTREHKDYRSSTHHVSG